MRDNIHISVGGPRRPSVAGFKKPRTYLNGDFTTIP